MLAAGARFLLAAHEQESKLWRKQMKVLIKSAVLVAVVLFASFGAQAKEEFTYQTPELMDKLNTSLDTTWPHDPAVPELPPMPVTDNPGMNQNAFLWTHFNDNIYPPRVEGSPEPGRGS